MNPPSSDALRTNKRPRIADNDMVVSRSTAFDGSEDALKDGTPKTEASDATPVGVFNLPMRVIRRPKKSILNKIMTHPELMLAFVAQLTPASLLDLYAISKPFHYLFNRHYTSFLLANIRVSCGSHTEAIFPYYAYKRLCNLDPTARDVNAPHPLAALRRPTTDSDVNPKLSKEHATPKLRQIPALKWLQMIVHRVTTIRRILARLWVYGFRVPFYATLLALQKLWLTLDLPTNGLRIGCLHNSEFWTDADLKVTWFFFATLDKRFTDPIDGTGCVALRKLLLGHRTLTPLLEALERRTYISQIELLKSAVNLRQVVSFPRHGMPVFGLTMQRVSRGAVENQGRGRSVLLPSDQLVMSELLRRRLSPMKLLLSFMIAGRSLQYGRAWSTRAVIQSPWDL